MPNYLEADKVNREGMMKTVIENNTANIDLPVDAQYIEPIRFSYFEEHPEKYLDSTNTITKNDIENIESILHPKKVLYTDSDAELIRKHIHKMQKLMDGVGNYRATIFWLMKFNEKIQNNQKLDSSFKNSIDTLIGKINKRIKSDSKLMREKIQSH